MTALVSVVAPRWVVAGPPLASQVDRLASALNIPRLLATLLIQRGFHEPESAKAYLRPSLDHLTPPRAVPGLADAVGVITRHVERGSRILIHGDYDVDGQCATALLTRALAGSSATVLPFVPNRLTDGYDFGPAGLARAVADGADLIITCDCGITALETVAAARQRGIDVIVTDHHLPGPALPEANAVVNPQLVTSSPNPLCGTGVAFKLVQALTPALKLPEALPLHLLDLVALATVADLVPLVGENRVLVRHGLKVLGRSRWPGVQALMASCRLSGATPRAGQVGFIVAPRLNAVGRIADAKDGLRLLLTDVPAEAAVLAERLETLNARRQEIDHRILGQAVDAIEASPETAAGKALVLGADEWHPGVIGIVASRLVERYAKPTILIAWEGDVGRGSGRSIGPLDLHAALVDSAGALERFGGHRMAAGLTVRRDRFEDFRRGFLEAVDGRLTPEDLVPRQRIDVAADIATLDARLERLIRYLEPCGMGNPAPVFGTRRARIEDPQLVGERHLRFRVVDESGSLAAIAFGWADRVAENWHQARADVAYKLEADDWRGSGALQARIVSMAPSAT